MSAFFRLLLNRVTLLSLLLLVTHQPVQAFDLLNGKLQVHGFFSQGMVKTSDNNFLGNSRDVSFDFREIALNGSYLALPNLRFSAQLMSHFAGASDNGMVDADYAFVDWTVFSSEWGRAGIRAGRIKTPYGIYNSTRFVPFSRPSIILPQSIYLERTRKVAVSGDGGEFYFDWFTDWGTFGFEALLGLPNGDDKATEVGIFGFDLPGKPNPQFSQNYHMSFESADKRLRLEVSSVNLVYSYSPSKIDPVRAGTITLPPYIFSAQYNAEFWSLTAEYAARPTEVSGFGLFPDRKFTGESAYIQGTYNILPKVELLARYDVSFTDRDDREGKGYTAKTGRPGFTQFSKDITFGVRYDLTPTLMLRAEYHNIDGTAILPALDNPDPGTLVRHWDMWMLLGSYRF